MSKVVQETDDGYFICEECREEHESEEDVLACEEECGTAVENEDGDLDCGEGSEDGLPCAECERPISKYAWAYRAGLCDDCTRAQYAHIYH